MRAPPPRQAASSLEGTSPLSPRAGWNGPRIEECCGVIVMIRATRARPVRVVASASSRRQRRLNVLASHAAGSQQDADLGLRGLKRMVPFEERVAGLAHTCSARGRRCDLDKTRDEPARLGFNERLSAILDRKTCCAVRRGHDRDAMAECLEQLD